MIYFVVVLVLLNLLTGWLLVISENRVTRADREVRLRDLQIAEALQMRDDYRDRVHRLRAGRIERTPAVAPYEDASGSERTADPDRPFAGPYR